MHLLSKLTSEIGPKIGGLGRKTEQNCLKVPTLPPSFFCKKKKKNTVYVENEKNFYAVKISAPTNFTCLR